MGLVDLHCHVLPGVDDGARDEAAALRMLRMAEEDGIRVVAATSHAHRCPAELVGPGVARLNQLAAEAGINIDIVPGSEVRLDAGLAKRYREGKLVTLNHGPYLLLELFLSGPWPKSTARVVAELQALGLRPILAHPERYPDVQGDPGIVRELVEMGVPMQLNADSLAGRTERDARPAAEELLRRRLAHLIASDAHNPDWRPPRLRAAFERAAELAGPDYAAWMAANALKVIHGEAIDLSEPG